MHLETIIVAIMVSILGLGGAITYFALKAYRRTGDPSLRGLMIGFGFVTLGALFGGIAHQLLDVGLDVGIVINSGLTAIGFAIITYSLFIE
ncbi:hypothetical protein EGH24_11570 [Halonotius terrestris]|uniref:Uncharacterized protein n=1 Tax=Halonotius terrestris TaxID=2487750 RepID=A0A8J8P8A3_9EURY|nr:hypothetical protein [Halonotius terrestris]TQQ79264.1 hypothetical protein EGH24_11570 [Halonotius terrestris]